jgi:leader peptidase (prepilin peptidase)/N-methyltransferase
MVELFVGGLWAATAWRYVGWALDPNESIHVRQLALLGMAGRIIFYWLLVALAMLDAEYLWLPNWLTWPGILIGFTYSLLPYYVIDRLPLLGIRRTNIAGLAYRSLIAILVAAGLVLVIRWLYWLLRRREGIGLGDAKLMALLAAWLGLPGALLAFALGVILGAFAALLLLAIPKARTQSESWSLTKLPLGTFLCIGGIITSLWGQQIIAAYLRWPGF